MQFIDTHCHIHDSEFFGFDGKPTMLEVIHRAHDAGVVSMLCVGTDVESSRQAVVAAMEHESLYASLALHPHEADKMTITELDAAVDELRSILEGKKDNIVAIGECGLDYFYHSDSEVIERQKHLLKLHLKLALDFDLPLIFHVREAFDDYFAILDEFAPIRGVVHSFSDSVENMQEAVKRGLYIGLNGIMTFTKDESQLSAASAVPLDKLVLETDAPFLTPKPFRGTICEPKHVVDTARFLSELRGEPIEQLAEATTRNAQSLFTIK